MSVISGEISTDFTISLILSVLSYSYEIIRLVPGKKNSWTTHNMK